MGNVQENRIRRQAARLGYMIRKSRSKIMKFNDLLGYMIVDADYNYVIAGCNFDFSLDDVAGWLDNKEKMQSDQEISE